MFEYEINMAEFTLNNVDSSYKPYLKGWKRGAGCRKHCRLRILPLILNIN